MTTTPHPPGHRLARPRHRPSGLKAEVSARIARRLFRAAVSPPARDRPRRQRLHPNMGHAAGRRCGSSDPTEFFARVGRDGLIGFGEAYLTGAWDAEDLGGFLTVLAAKLPTLIPAPLQKLRAAYVRRPPAGAQEHRAQHPRQHLAPLRPVQRPVPAVPRRDAELLLGALRHLVGRPRRPPRRPRPRRAATASRWPRHRCARSSGCSTRRGVGEGTRVLEIGTGWGELAIRAARRGATVHSVTLSSEQLELAERRIAEAGYADQVTLELSDYRDVQGSLRRDRVRGDDRGRRPRVLVDVLPHHRPAARARWPRRHPGDHDAARPDARDPEHLDLDQQVHLPRRIPALGHGDRRDHPRRHDACGSATGSRSARTTRRPWSAGTTRSWRPATRCVRSGSTRPSSGCGTSTWSTRGPGSRPATSTCNS